MRSKLIAVVFVTLLALPASVSAKTWWNPGTWFNKKARSTTVTGTVDAVADGKVSFKTVDGQMLQLIGDQAAQVGENRSVKIRVFGNIFKPEQKYPAGAIQVRKFQVLEQAPVVVPEPENTPEPYVEPEPVVEPIAEPVLEPVAEPAPVATTDEYDDADDNNAALSTDTEDESAEKTYVVASGDTLGKISSKIYGTSSKWKKIAEHNGISNPKLLKVGMTLRLP